MVATPGDVLAYRQAWDPYVMSTLRGLTLTADEFDGVSKNPPAGFTAAQLSGMAASYRSVANAYLAAWNAYAGQSPEVIVLGAADALASFQETVKKVGSMRASPSFRQWYNGPALEPPPSADAQRAIISELEGTSLVARGFLDVLTGSATSGLTVIAEDAGKVAGGVVKGAGGVGKSLLGAVFDALPWWGWAGLGLAGYAGLTVVVKASPLAMLLPRGR